MSQATVGMPFSQFHEGHELVEIIQSVRPRLIELYNNTTFDDWTDWAEKITLDRKMKMDRFKNTQTTFTTKLPFDYTSIYTDPQIIVSHQSQYCYWYL